MTKQVNPHDLLASLDDYSYQPQLTARLDAIGGNTSISRETAYEIVLWKLDRFVEFSDSLIDEINSVASLSLQQRGEARPVLRSLLKTPGIRLPMASTILRFRNPLCFQIIDERAYRQALPKGEAYPAKPQKLTDGWLSRSENIYFGYLDRLDEIARDSGVEFKSLDRALYQADIKAGHKIRKPTA
jgi:hypothetical protein